MRRPSSRTNSPPSRRPSAGEPSTRTRTRRWPAEVDIGRMYPIDNRRSSRYDRPVPAGHDAELDVAPIQASSVVSLAYERIRALILTGDIPPGTRLGQVDLADRLGVSRTPVREALRRLDAEGLVDFQDNRGFRVAELAIEDVVRRLEVRLLLEPGIARLAAERATDADLHALEANVRREERARSAQAVHDASREFHLLVAAAAHNGELVATIEGLWLIEVGRR